MRPSGLVRSGAADFIGDHWSRARRKSFAAEGDVCDCVCVAEDAETSSSKRDGGTGEELNLGPSVACACDDIPMGTQPGIGRSSKGPGV